MKHLISFTIGASIGALASWLYHKNKYEEMVKEELYEIKRHYKSSFDDSKNQKDTKENKDIKEIKVDNITNISKEHIADVDIQNSIIDRSSYRTPSATNNELVELSADEFGNEEDFETDSFFYHVNGTINNYNGDQLEDVDGTLGLSYEEIGQKFKHCTDENVIYIRNYKLKYDYEVILDEFEE